MVEFCAQGFSLTAFAAKVGVSRDSLDHWMRVHPEFSEAADRARAACAKWWEDRARIVAETGGTRRQAGMVRFALRNLAPGDFADTRRQEISGPRGEPRPHRLDETGMPTPGRTKASERGGNQP